jgi:hypothetical protein
METGWTEEKEVELSPLLFKPRPNQETEKEYSEQGQATSPSQIPTPVGAGLDVDLQVGMFWKMPVLELAMELLDLLTINLVLPPGAAFANPKRWLWEALVAEVLARLWGYLVSQVLVQIARHRHSAALMMGQDMTHGNYTHRRRLNLWLHKTLSMEASHLLLWLASTM